MSSLRIAHPSLCHLWSWDCTKSSCEGQEAAGKVLQNSKLGWVATWILTGREDLHKIWTIYVKANSAFSLHLNASSLWSETSWTEVTGRRTCSRFFKPFRRRQLSERDKQLSVGHITQIIAYVSTQKGNTKSRPAKPKLLVPSTAGKGDSWMAGELQLLLLKGTGRAPALLHFMQTQRAGSCQEDSPPCLRSSVASWSLLLESTEELKRDFLKLKTRCQEKPCQSTAVLRLSSWRALHVLVTPNFPQTCIPQQGNVSLCGTQRSPALTLREHQGRVKGTSLS